MIKIGNAIINEAEIAAIYPSLNTDGKMIIALKSGRTVWVMASMEEMRMALQAECGDILTPKVATEISVLEHLMAGGFHFIARDECGPLWAFDSEPEKDVSCWNAKDGKAHPVCADLFDGVVEWPDQEAVEIDTLVEDMALHPEKYEG